MAERLCQLVQQRLNVENLIYSHSPIIYLHCVLTIYSKYFKYLFNVTNNNNNH